MLPIELARCKHFSLAELVETGANIEKIDSSLMFRLEKFRVRLGKKIKILCINTGSHVDNSYHYEGRAVDFIIIDPFDPSSVVELLAWAGFRGVGVYYNGSVYSFHGDIREGDFQIWTAVPIHHSDGSPLSELEKRKKWNYMGCLNDPKKIYNEQHKI